MNNQVFRQLLRHRGLFFNVRNIHAAKVPIVNLLQLLTQISYDISSTNAIWSKKLVSAVVFLDGKPPSEEVIRVSEVLEETVSLFRHQE